mmetsp:Transcript_18989/g.59663  ORF Transcript_18989/g.59663 Transcript_18989/m.59663 type:complete len:200 (+) Transcript_18989:280-879(+)
MRALPRRVSAIMVAYLSSWRLSRLSCLSGPVMRKRVTPRGFRQCCVRLTSSSIESGVLPLMATTRSRLARIWFCQACEMEGTAFGVIELTTSAQEQVMRTSRFLPRRTSGHSLRSSLPTRRPSGTCWCFLLEVSRTASSILRPSLCATSVVTVRAEMPDAKLGTASISPAPSLGRDASAPSPAGPAMSSGLMCPVRCLS